MRGEAKIWRREAKVCGFSFTRKHELRRLHVYVVYVWFSVAVFVLSQALEHAVLTFWKITTKLIAKVMTICGIFSKCLGGGGVLLRYLDQTHSPLLLYSDELTFPQ